MSKEFKLLNKRGMASVVILLLVVGIILFVLFSISAISFISIVGSLSKLPSWFWFGSIGLIISYLIIKK